MSGIKTVLFQPKNETVPTSPLLFESRRASELQLALDNIEVTTIPPFASLAVQTAVPLYHLLRRCTLHACRHQRLASSFRQISRGSSSPIETERDVCTTLRPQGGAYVVLHDSTSTVEIKTAINKLCQ